VIDGMLVCIEVYLISTTAGPGPRRVLYVVNVVVASNPPTRSTIGNARR
jgi:hypothetical protein